MIDKVDTDGNTPLEGAELTLEKKIKGQSNKVVAKDMTLSTDTVFTFTGLDDGDYVLTETKVPEGYKFMSPNPIEFTVTADHAVVWDVKGAGDATDAKRAEALEDLAGDVTTGEITLEKDLNEGSLAGKLENQPSTPPEFEKKVKDVNDSDGKGESKPQDSADYDIGDDVPFVLTAKLADNVTDYVKYHITFHDTLGTGVDGKTAFGTPTDFAVTMKDESFAKTLTWTGADGKRIADDKLNGATVELTFKAELLPNANLGVKGNLNTAHLTYSNNPNLDQAGEPIEDEGKTDEDAVIVFTYKVEINKKDETGEQPRTGAEFLLQKVLADGKLVTVKTVKSADGAPFTFTGLDDGDYILTETKAPDGYKLAEPIRFSVVPDHQDDKEYDGVTSPLVKLNGNVVDGVINLTADKNLATLSGNLKNQPPEEPKFEKKVIDTNDTTGKTEGPQDSADYDIGDEVPFVLTATLADNVTDYLTYYVTFHDEMEEGLTFETIESVTVNGSAVSKYILCRRFEPLG